jgi:hypothetical protein
MKTASRIILTLSLLALTMAGFQNCSGVTYGTKTAEKPQNSGNGDGYTGKLYVEFGTCGLDAHSVKAKIWAVPELDQYTLLRENCADLANSLKIAPSSVTKSADLLKLKYSGREFVLYAAAPRIDSAGPFGPLGMGVALTGENLCGPGGVKIEETSGAAYLSFGISNVNCSGGGTLLTFNPPTNFANRTEPVVNLRLTNLDLPVNLNWAAFSLKPAEMLTPKIISFNDVMSLMNGREIEIMGQFFGCPNTTVEILDPAGNIAVPVNIVGCSDSKVNIMPVFGLAVILPGTSVRVSNGARSASLVFP